MIQLTLVVLTFPEKIWNYIYISHHSSTSERCSFLKFIQKEVITMRHCTDTTIIIQETAFENISSIMTTPLFTPQCVKLIDIWFLND